MIFVHSANSNGLSSDPGGDNKSDESFYTANGSQGVNENGANFNLDSNSRESSMDEFVSIAGSGVGSVKGSVSKNKVVKNKIYVLEDDTNDIRLLQDQLVQPDLKCFMIDDKGCLKIRWNMNELNNLFEMVRSIIDFNASDVKSIEITSVKDLLAIEESKVVDFAVKLGDFLADAKAAHHLLKIGFKIRCEYDEGFGAISYIATINALKNQGNSFINNFKDVGQSFGLNVSVNKILYIKFDSNALEVVNLTDVKNSLKCIGGAYEYNISLADSNKVNKCNIKYSSDGILSIEQKSYSKDIIDLIKNINNNDKKFNKIKFKFNEIGSKDAVLELLKLITVDILIFDVIFKKTKIMSYVNNQLLLRLVEKYSQDIIDVIANDQRFKDIKLHFDQDITINEYKELLNDKIIKDNRKLFVKIKDKDIILFENEKLTINGISYSKDVISAIAGNNVLKCIELSFNKNIEVNEYGELLELIKNGRKLCVNVVGNSGGLFSGAISTDVIKFDHASELIVSCQKYSKDIVDAVMSKSVENVKLKFIEDVDADIYLELLKKFVNNKKKLSFTAGEQEIVLNDNKLKLKFHEYSSAIVDAIINCGIKVVEFNLSSEIDGVICKKLIEEIVSGKLSSILVNVGDKSVFEFKDGVLYVDLLIDNNIRYLIFNNNSFNDIRLKSNSTGDDLLRIACDLVSKYSKKNWRLGEYCSFNEGKLCVQSENCAKALELIANHSCWQHLKSIVIYDGKNNKLTIDFKDNHMAVNHPWSLGLFSGAADLKRYREEFKNICEILKTKLNENTKKIIFVLNETLYESELNLIMAFDRDFEIMCKSVDDTKVVMSKCVISGYNCVISGEDFAFTMTNNVVSIKSDNIIDCLSGIIEQIDGKDDKFIGNISGKILNLDIDLNVNIDSTEVPMDKLIELSIKLCNDRFFSSVKVKGNDFYSYENGFNIDLNDFGNFYYIVNFLLSKTNCYFHIKCGDLFVTYSDGEFSAKFDCSEVKNIEKLIKHNKSNMSQISNKSKINESNISKADKSILDIPNISPIDHESNISKISYLRNKLNALNICIEDIGTSLKIGDILKLLSKNKQSSYKYTNKNTVIYVNNFVDVGAFSVVIEVAESYINIVKYGDGLSQLVDNMGDYAFRVHKNEIGAWSYSCDENKYISKSMNGILGLFNDFIVIVNGEVTIKSSNDSILDLCKLKSLINGIESIERVEDLKKNLLDLYKKKLDILLEVLDVDSCNIEANDIISQGAIKEVMGDLGINNDNNVFSSILGDSSEVGDPDSDGENSEKYPSGPDVDNGGIPQSSANNDLDGNHNYWLVGGIMMVCVIIWIYNQSKDNGNMANEVNFRIINEMSIENFNIKSQDPYVDLSLSAEEMNQEHGDLSSQEVNKGFEDSPSQEVSKGTDDLLSQESVELLPIANENYSSF